MGAEEKQKKEAAKKIAEQKKKMEEEKEEENKEEEEKKEEEEPEVVVDFENLDIFGVEKVTDLGGGMPLYHAFENDDWALLELQYELYLLVHAFKKDVEDKDRSGIRLEHLAFYYQKYFSKQLVPADYGCKD